MNFDSFHEMMESATQIQADNGCISGQDRDTAERIFSTQQEMFADGGRRVGIYEIDQMEIVGGTLSHERSQVRIEGVLETAVQAETLETS